MSHLLSRRTQEQEWLYDLLIKASGPDFYWPMTGRALATVGMDGSNDIQYVRSSIKKYADIPREMMKIGEKREAIAKRKEAEGHFLTAGQNYFTAAAYYTFAQGTFHIDDDPLNLELSRRKNACYAKYIEYADHRIEKVEIPFGKTSLPGYLHFPLKPAGDPPPCIVFLGGMDNFTELLVTRPSDKILERGMAVLVFDGPGQNEARITRKIFCTEDNFIEAGRSAMDFLQARSDIDRDKIGINGTSMGSYWMTQIVAHDHRYKAGSCAYVCHEPGMRTIFNNAVPIFRERYMWMAGYGDEQKFDAFIRRHTLEGLGPKVTCPFLIQAGEDDELSPIQNSIDLYESIKTPKTMLIYKGETHGISDGMAVRAYAADWLKDRLDGKPLESRRVYIDARTGLEVG